MVIQRYLQESTSLYFISDTDYQLFKKLSHKRNECLLCRSQNNHTQAKNCRTEYKCSAADISLRPPGGTGATRTVGSTSYW
jgi:hypothetical protein